MKKPEDSIDYHKWLNADLLTEEEAQSICDWVAGKTSYENIACPNDDFFSLRQVDGKDAVVVLIPFYNWRPKYEITVMKDEVHLQFEATWEHDDVYISQKDVYTDLTERQLFALLVDPTVVILTQLRTVVNDIFGSMMRFSEWSSPYMRLSWGVKFIPGSEERDAAIRHELSMSSRQVVILKDGSDIRVNSYLFNEVKLDYNIWTGGAKEYNALDVAMYLAGWSDGLNEQE